MDRLVAWFKDLAPHAVEVAGGKGASLGDMARTDLPVPAGFVVCTTAFELFLELNNGLAFIRNAVEGLNVHQESDLDKAARMIHDFVLATPIPQALSTEVRTAYIQLGDMARVAVRSSAVSEDSDGASFAGQQETYLNLRGADEVLKHIQMCWASFFTPRALFYRAQKGSLNDVSIAVVVQRMVKAEKSGVSFTVDPVRHRRDQMMIEAIYGLGEAIVSGQITPNNYLLDRDTGELIQEYVGIQTFALACSEEGSGTIEVPVPEEQGGTRVLTDAELANLRELSLRLEQYFGKPQDVEWCIEGDQLHLLQSRPITTL